MLSYALMKTTLLLRGWILGALSLALATAVAVPADAQEPPAAVRGFALAFLPYAPGSSIDIQVDGTSTLPTGTYMALTAVRSTIDPNFKDQLGMLLDPTTGKVSAGLMFPLTKGGPGVSPADLPDLVETSLPAMLGSIFGTRARVHWPAGPARPSAVIELTSELSTGYGWVRMPVALSGDGRYLILGSSWELGRDVRAQRREMLAAAHVEWDPGHDNAPVKVIEFSDFECPACKHAWGVLKPVLAGFGAAVHHGMVNFPLVHNHPWAFRAAVAGSCIYSLWPDQLLNLKEEFYRLQDTMTVETVDDAVFGFLDQRQLDEKSFRACYLKDPVIDAVLKQIELGQRLGVFGTPTYYANGEVLPVSREEWFAKRLQAIIDAGGKPEAAMEIVVNPPTPVPSPSPSPTPKL
jgi:Thioredoxin